MWICEEGSRCVSGCDGCSSYIEVEPVRHAKWRVETEYYDDDYSECNTRKVFACSLCGRTERTKQPYCNCGAKMDEEEKDDSSEIVYCKDCEHLMFSDCYGECKKAYRGIVSPNDSCGRGERKSKK